MLEVRPMSTFQHRPNSGLVVVDVQNGAVRAAHERDAVVANVATLVQRARAEGVPVVWIQHVDEELVRGSEAWKIVAELVPHPGEPIVEKHYRDAFEDTEFESTLLRLGIGKLIVVGAQTDMCVRSTIHGAFVRGYDVTLVGDAHTTEDMTQWGAPHPGQVISHTNMYWGSQTAPGRLAATVRTEDVNFAGGGSLDGGPRNAAGTPRVVRCGHEISAIEPHCGLRGRSLAGPGCRDEPLCASANGGRRFCGGRQDLCGYLGSGESRLENAAVLADSR
jgi:Isochorismatase family